MEIEVFQDDSIEETIDSKFRYVLVVAERAEQLMRGARAKIEISGAKPTRVAQEEIERELVDWDYGPAPQPDLELIGIDESENAEAMPVGEGEEVDTADVH